ncbi:MAG: hypothetical protein WD009_02575 [Phycisphaeraceae bacterium]
MSNTAAALACLAAAAALAIVLALAYHLTPRHIPPLWQPMTRWLLIWSLILLVPGLVAVAGLVGLSTRVAGEAVLVADEPASEAYDRVNVYLVGDATRLPWRDVGAVDARWMDVEMLGLPWGDFRVRLESRSLAPPGVTLTGPDRDPLYPIDELTLPELLRREGGLYPDDQSRAELAALARAMRWLSDQREIDATADAGSAGADDDAGHGDALWHQRYGPALEAHFETVDYTGPRIYNEPANAALAARPLIVVAVIWALGVITIGLSRRPLIGEVKA